MQNKSSPKFTFYAKGKLGLFTTPETKYSGEKTSYPVPTYEALKGLCRSVYWKPTLVWVVDRVRVLNEIKFGKQGVRELNFNDGGADIMHYNYLMDVHYQIEAHFEWNLQRPDLEKDRNMNKHVAIAKRAIASGGRLDTFLGSRECQCAVGPCTFGEEYGYYDHADYTPYEPSEWVMHSFGYPNETGEKDFYFRRAQIVMNRGIIEFPAPAFSSEEDEKRGLKRFLLKANASQGVHLGNLKSCGDELNELIEMGLL